MPSKYHFVPELVDFTPVELAARARSLDGVAFFDSAREAEDGSAQSLLVAEPEFWLEGNLFVERDFAVLQKAVAVLSSEEARFDDGFPGSVLAGVVGYSGDFQFGMYRRLLLYRHREGRWYANDGWWRRLVDTSDEVSSLDGRLDFRPVVAEETFCGWVENAQEYIGAGDIYQVNLSHKLESPWPGGDPWAFYEALRHYSPAPYGAFLKQPGRTILSSSPELFLRFSGRSVRTRPIKGTRPRRSGADADERSAFELITSPKEIAELVMITDLERNDLGQFCEWGSVEVRELLKLERHEQVFHLVSTVEGRMREAVDQVEALRACFPGGSITGAPKRRARQIIEEIEGEARGLYTGACGWFGGGGESVFSILIRTVVVEEGRAHFHVGAGVVADSKPEAEWQETWDKAAGILLAAERIIANLANPAG